jgi:thioesterase domain-containing protein
MRVGYARIPDDFNPARYGALVELRQGGGRNLFLVHDGNADVLLYYNFARRMPDNLRVFGIEPRSIDRVPIAHTRIEQMARYYIGELRKIQPHGPYLLGGLCAGGVIAYEMAAQLTRADETIERLIMFEAATPQAAEKPFRVANQRMKRLTGVITDARDSDRSTIAKAWLAISGTLRKVAHAAFFQIKWRAHRWSIGARFRLLHWLIARQLPWPGTIRPLTAMEIYEFAHFRYVPRPLPKVPVTLVRAQRRSFIASDLPYKEIYADEVFGWGALIPELVVIDADGGHSTMLEDPFVAPLVAALVPHINPAFEAPRHRSFETATQS